MPIDHLRASPPVHPAADAFRLLDDGEQKALVESIRTLGQLEPIQLSGDGQLLDGRSRLLACAEIGIEPETEIVETDDPVAFVVAKNVTRRHLSPGELAVVADKLARLPRGRPSSERPKERTQDEAADLMRASRRTVQRVAALRAGGREDLYEAVARGEITPAAAGKRMKRDARAAAMARRAVPMPDGTFPVIVADPPWRYEKRQEDESSRGRAADHYETLGDGEGKLTVEQLKALPVPDHAEDDCVLWLWTTNAHLLCGEDPSDLTARPVAIDVVTSWGFRPVTILTWDKVHLGTGDWLRGQTEHCIMAVKGSPVVDLTNQTTIIRERRRDHSRKPEVFYALIDKLCPGPKLELFGRTPRPGYVLWGNETEKYADQSANAPVAH